MSEGAGELHEGVQAEYIRATWSGQNDSGYRAIGDRIIIKMDACAEKVRGILRPLDWQERMTLAAESGIIVAVGGAAFRFYDDGSPWDHDIDPPPKAGDRVSFERYSGAVLPRGKDGAYYRMMTYTCVGGVEAPAETKPAKVARGQNGKGKQRRVVTSGNGRDRGRGGRATAG